MGDLRSRAQAALNWSSVGDDTKAVIHDQMAEIERLRAEIDDWKLVALAMRDEAIRWANTNVSTCSKIEDIYFNAAMFGPSATDGVAPRPRAGDHLATAAIDKLRTDLEWRGPNGGKMGHVVLKREHAEALANLFDERKQWRPEPTHRHRKRGTYYRVNGRSVLQSSGGPIAEGTELTHYVGRDGDSWSRPTAEFNDGRFECLPHTITKLPGQ
jgi:hypothetical protein